MATCNRVLYFGSFGRNELEIRRISDDHIRAIVTTPRGRVYAATIARDIADEARFPTTSAHIARLWKVDRKAFLPFNTSEGVYVS